MEATVPQSLSMVIAHLIFSTKNRILFFQIAAFTAFACLASFTIAQVADEKDASIAGIPVNYTEAKVGNYTLPHPLKMSDGKRVSDTITWFAKRRPEIVKLFGRRRRGIKPAQLLYINPEARTVHLTFAFRPRYGIKAQGALDSLRLLQSRCAGLLPPSRFHHRERGARGRTQIIIVFSLRYSAYSAYSASNSPSNETRVASPISRVVDHICGIGKAALPGWKLC
jgi:hypothetical protein